MTAQSEKSIQELRSEIQRLENTEKLNGETIKRLQAELSHANTEGLEKLRLEIFALKGDNALSQTRIGQLLRQVEQCVHQVLGYGPNIGNIEDLLPKVTERVLSLQKQAEDLRRTHVGDALVGEFKREIADLKKERDANKMEALEAQRVMRNEQYRSEAFKRRIDELESSEDLQRAKATVEHLTKELGRAKDKVSTYGAATTRLEYSLRELEQERDEIEEKYERMSRVDNDRQWACTNKNAYDELLALRDLFVPHAPLGNTREALMRLFNELQSKVRTLSQLCSEKDELATGLEESYVREKVRKEEIHALYNELRDIFHLGGISPTDAKRIHAAIKHMLVQRGEEIRELSEKLEKERTLACEEIRRLQNALNVTGTP
jgi:hypothetical protein